MDKKEDEDEDEKKVEAEFKKIAEYLNEGRKSFKFSQQDMLRLYGYFKQAKVGKCKGSRPGLFNVRDRAKYDAWKACEHLTRKEAMKKYIEFAKEHVSELKMHVSL